MNPNRMPPKNIAAAIILTLALSQFFISTTTSQQLTNTLEYTNNVHTFLYGNQGNFTQIDKPIFPVYINNSQIKIGENWTIVCPLQANHNYHVYCYGKWVNTSSAAKTDYDIYVYDPSGNLESSHTEAAGFPEHLGTTSNDALFTPKTTGNYSFMLKNDARESQGDQQATFMVMENIQCNSWCQSTIEGKGSNHQSRFHTCWAYEFSTNASKLEIYLRVPESLDMYEARLYLMSNTNSLVVNNLPLPWEPGLYGNRSANVGGYNFETEAYRGVSYASCEYMGQDMYLNHTSTNKGENLYHLVLIGEEGSGNIEFMVKTMFNNISLTSALPTTREKMLPNLSNSLSFQSNGAAIKNANLSYTNDNWAASNTIKMEVNNQTCNATIPGQKAGTSINYTINAIDILENQFFTNGSYTIKAQPKITISIVKQEITLGQNVTLTGKLEPNDNSSLIEIKFFTSNTTKIATSPVDPTGNFTVSFQPSEPGAWAILAESYETNTLWKTGSPQFTITVKEPPLYIKYSLYIIIGLVVSCAVGGVVWFLKFRNK